MNRPAPTESTLSRLDRVRTWFHAVHREEKSDQTRAISPADGRAALARLFAAAGYASIRILGTRPSIYREAVLYAAAVA